MTEQQLLNQNTETFRDENSDAWKLKGKTRATEARGFFSNIISSIYLLLAGKADTGHGHTISDVDNLQATLNSHNQRITSNTNALPLKADLVDGKVPLEQLPDDIGGGVDITIDSVLSTVSENPVQNKVITTETQRLNSRINTADNDQKTLKMYKHSNFNGF